MFLMPRAARALRSLTLIVALLFSFGMLGGCATNNARDPLEPMNRVIYQFNDGVDTAIVRPLAEGYRFVLPQFLRNSISNFFSNINDVLVALNNLLQGKFVDALSDMGRVMMNSTLGFGGLFDIASEVGMEKHNEDFGQTLGRWGVGSGPYLVLPFLGPSTIRDAAGRAVDGWADPLRYLNDIAWRNSLWGTRFVSNRADLLDTSRILETAALDPYEFVRDAFLQRRRSLIFDGNPPREKDEDAQVKPAAAAVVADSPFPRTPGENAEPGTPFNLMSARADEAPAAPDTQTPAPVVTRESPGVAPAGAASPAAQEDARVELTLPAEPTGAGAAQPSARPAQSERAASPRVARVWLAPLSVGAQ